MVIEMEHMLAQMDRLDINWLMILLNMCKCCALSFVQDGVWPDFSLLDSDGSVDKVISESPTQSGEASNTDPS